MFSCYLLKCSSWDVVVQHGVCQHSYCGLMVSLPLIKVKYDNCGNIISNKVNKTSKKAKDEKHFTLEKKIWLILYF